MKARRGYKLYKFPRDLLVFPVSLIVTKDAMTEPPYTRRLSKQDLVLATLDALIISTGLTQKKPLDDLRERKKTLEENLKEIKKVLDDLVKEISYLNEKLNDAAKKRKKQGDMKAREMDLEQCASELEDCQRVHSSFEIQSAAIDKQIEVLEAKEAEDPSGRMVSITDRKVLAISDDGFPRQPPKGTIYVHYDDGFIQHIPDSTPLESARLKEKHGFEKKGYYEAR
ncbi:hypothetical protein AAMO2058_000853800 [Amorphochlora amoebiformis]